MGNGSRSHHLLKHALPDVDVKEYFGSIEPKEIMREINRLGQRELQARFRAVYGTQTFSNNNNWLRRKLLEAAGLQTPKAAARGRPSARQPRAVSSGSAPGSDTSLSRTCSMASQSISERRPSPVSIIRRTKRARKPRCFEDMLLLPHAFGGVHSDDDDQPQPAYCPMTASSLNLDNGAEQMASSSSGAVPASTADMVWGPSASQGYSAGQILVSPEVPTCAWPTTPEGTHVHRHGTLPEGYSTAACQLLGRLVANGDVDLCMPDWARLGADREAADTAADVTAPMGLGASHTATRDMPRMSSSSGCFAPGTPPRPVPSSSPLDMGTPPTAAAAAVAAAFGSAPFAPAALPQQQQQQQPHQQLPLSMPADFDCFAFAHGCEGADLVPGADDYALPASQDFGVASSDASDASALDMMLEELSSHQELSADLSTFAPLDGMWESREDILGTT